MVVVVFTNIVRSIMSRCWRACLLARRFTEYRIFHFYRNIRAFDVHTGDLEPPICGASCGAVQYSARSMEELFYFIFFKKNDHYCIQRRDGFRGKRRIFIRNGGPKARARGRVSYAVQR